ncbi:MAG: TIM barrel protein [Actinobacteria bacterium]|nr:TIM barrel protein [Actinomycetota bacterium]
MSVARLKLATSPTSWGVDFADAPDNPPWELVLDEIAASPVDALELGPFGYLPEDPHRLRAALSGRGLTAVGSFVFDDLHDPACRERILAHADHSCAAIAAAQGELLVVIDRPGPGRTETAGRSDAAPRLDDRRWSSMIDLVDEIAAVAEPAGLRPVFHPHAGSWVEFADEIDRFLTDSSHDLCLDLGHAAFAGIGAAEAIDAWGGRVGYLHLKDVDPVVLRRVREQRLDFWEAIAARVFCPLGDGAVDLEAAAERLGRLGYAGYATIEQDRRPGGGDPVADLERSIAALERSGFAAEDRRREATGGQAS